MNQLSTMLLQAQAGQGSSWTGFAMIIAMIAIFYFFMIRPQQKRQKELKQQRESMKNGDKVVTSGGIHGKIREITDNVIMIEIAQGVTIKVSKDAVFPLVTESPKK